MDTQNTNDSVHENLNITEPDPELLKSCLNNVFGGPVSPDPEEDAESISSIEEYQEVSSEAEASKAWADAKIEAEVQAGLKPYCSRCGTDSPHTEVQCTASSGRNDIKRKVRMASTASQVRFPSGKGGILRGLGRTSIRS